MSSVVDKRVKANDTLHGFDYIFAVDIRAAVCLRRSPALPVEGTSAYG